MSKPSKQCFSINTYFSNRYFFAKFAVMSLIQRMNTYQQIIQSEKWSSIIFHKVLRSWYIEQWKLYFVINKTVQISYDHQTLICKYFCIIFDYLGNKSERNLAY